MEQVVIGAIKEYLAKRYELHKTLTQQYFKYEQSKLFCGINSLVFQPIIHK
jgi:hypothetical protein